MRVFPSHCECTSLAVYKIPVPAAPLLLPGRLLSSLNPPVLLKDKELLPAVSMRYSIWRRKETPHHPQTNKGDLNPRIMRHPNAGSRERQETFYPRGQSRIAKEG